ncbi:MAG: Prokaryotic s of the domain [Thermoproteota archaeon]|nr:Prokaryotic s of the domain [Thermoproteota archaeon]
MTVVNGVSKVAFEAGALMTIRNAVVEAYPKESFGILYGEARNGALIVSHAQVMQEVDRTSNSITPDLRAKRTIDCLMDSDNMEVLGSYHSHPKTVHPYLSKVDIKYWPLFDETIQVVVSANPTRLRWKKWHKADEKMLATRVVADKPLTLRLSSYTRRANAPRGYTALPVGKRKKIAAL